MADFEEKDQIAEGVNEKRTSRSGKAPSDGKDGSWLTKKSRPPGQSSQGEQACATDHGRPERATPRPSRGRFGAAQWAPTAKSAQAGGR